jgi:ATP-dependent RNA helicase RhlE
MNHFSELNLCPALQNNLTRHGLIKPTPVQAESIPPALEGKDVVATAQTGTGKTLGFALPILQALANQKNSGIRAIVLSPTRELAIQIDETFNKLAPGTGIKTAVVVGGVNESHQIRALKAGAQVVIATPGRLSDFLQRKLIKLGSVKTVVLDEADRMLDMGFLPSIKAILEQLPKQRQTLLFSATIEKSVARLIESYVTEPVRVAIGATTKPAEHVDLNVYELHPDRKLPLLVHLTKEEKGSFVVFVRTKHGADRLAKQLSGQGVKSARIHGDRTQSQRNQALQGFKDGAFQVLVATDVAARGIHVDGVAHVVNFDLPQVAEDFIHRVGRTGRAGARGTASTFFTRDQRNDIRQIERVIKSSLNRREIPVGMEELAPAKVVVIPQKTFAKPYGEKSYGQKSVSNRFERRRRR